jgi:acyl-CoA dehydrogenase
MIDFSPPDELLALRDKVATFVRNEIVPMEKDPRQGPHGPEESLRLDLVGKARDAGLLSPHAPAKWGGLGLDNIGNALVFEAACYSPLGALALNIQAPDEGNVHLLDKVATDAQKERWLRPLAEGRIRTVFHMTEPDGGAGSDPSLMKTVAKDEGDAYVINGRKWLISGIGAPGVGLNIIMAKTLSASGEDLGASMFLLDGEVPGMEIVRTLDTMDSNTVGAHCEVTYDDVRVPKDQLLGEPGKGFRYAQIRLAPARLTHCMRWLGQAVRCHEIAVEYARTRMAFGKPIGEHEGVGFQLADNETDLHLARLATWHCAWVLDQGQKGRRESSLAKVFVSEALCRVVDRCVQVLGGLGITADTVVEQTYRDIRAFRIYDGPSEVHRWAQARDIMRGA